MAQNPHIIVVGAGIIGASIAFHLSRGGARVSIVSTNGAGGPATRDSFAWINASWGNDAAYFRFRMESISRWKRLNREVPGLSLQWGGSLTFDLNERDLRAYVEEFSSRGYPVRLVDGKESRQLEPSLVNPPSLAAFAEAEGAAEPSMATDALITASGAQVITLIVHGVDVAAGRAVGIMTSAGPIVAQQVVLAAGAGVPALLITAGVKLNIGAPPGLLVHTAPLPPLLRRLVIGPGIHLRQTLDGNLVAGSDFGGSPVDQGAMKAAADMMEQIRGMVRGAEDAKFERYTVGYRPMPTDERPIVGYVPGIAGLYIALTHSGITNAPLIGALAAQELLGGERDRLMRFYGPGRFVQA